MAIIEDRHTPVFPDEEHFGLSKLEYAAIHIFAACCADGNHELPGKEWIIAQAHELFDELEKE